MAFYEQVKPLWSKSNMTLAQLAELCNISESSASRYLNGKVNPPADVAEKILTVLGGPDTETGGQGMQTAMQEIREIYEAHITRLQAEHASQVLELRRDKLILFVALMIAFCVIIYLCIDALHGNWGFFRYTMGG